MSRPISPVSAPGGSTIDSAIVQDNKISDHADHGPEYIGSDHDSRRDASGLHRGNSQMSQTNTYTPSKGGTLKKKASLHKTGSVKRSGSRRSSYAGSVRSVKIGDKERYEPAEYNSAFYCPIPISSNPTEMLANRFQAWRRVLKDLITYFQDLHKSYDVRAKAMFSAQNVISNIGMPSDFLQSGGIGDATEILRDFHKLAINEANKSRELEEGVIMQLRGLRSDLSQKIKEIKSLSSDFKNSVHKEQEGTRKAVNALQEALGNVDQDVVYSAGRGDPFLIKMAVERQLDRQIEEENYLHRAFLNLETSGRELESIVVGEIQKAYTVLAGIMKRDADGHYDAAEKLREGPLAITRDREWDHFVTDNVNMVDPRQPLRQVQNISYEGKNHPAAIEVKSGMLERKSKYLKNYTPGWYILSPTHLHEFKSADQIPFQAPVMSLFLPEQKLGSHSEPGSSSHKFMVKGRQTGSMHRGHTWIFRAETHDTMMAWFNDIRELTEKRGEARNEFVRKTHARSASGSSNRAPSVASGESQMDEDEADKIAFSGEQSVRGMSHDHILDGGLYGAGALAGSGLLSEDAQSDAGRHPPKRPQPGGRFPSEVNVTRGLQAPLSPSSGDSGDENDREILAAASALPGSAIPFVANTSQEPHTDLQISAPSGRRGSIPNMSSVETGYTAGEHPRINANLMGAEVAPDTQSQYHEWIGTAGAGLAGAGVGALGATAVQRHNGQQKGPENVEDEMASPNPAVPSEGHSSAPMAVYSGDCAAVQSGLHRESGPTGITASAYQATTMPVTKPAVGKETAIPVDEPQATNGSLISGTDIRIPAGSGTKYNSETAATTPTPVVTVSSTAQLTSTITPQPLSSTSSAISAPITSITSTSVPTSEPVTTTKTSTTAASTTEETAVASTSTRPTPIHTKSVQTISDLHIPGEFPKSAATAPGAN